MLMVIMGGCGVFFVYRMSLLSGLFIIKHTHTHNQFSFVRNQGLAVCRGRVVGGALTSVLRGTRVVQTSSWDDTCRPSPAARGCLLMQGREQSASVPSCFMEQT